MTKIEDSKPALIVQRWWPRSTYILYKEYHSVCLLVGKGLFEPLSRQRGCPLSLGGHTRLRVRGWGSPNFDDWRKSLALCLLCGGDATFPYHSVTSLCIATSCTLLDFVSKHIGGFPQTWVFVDKPRTKSIEKLIKYTQTRKYLSTDWRYHRVHRVATVAFWRTFDHEGKISPVWCGWGVHAHPLSLLLPSPVKLHCTLQLSRQIH